MAMTSPFGSLFYARPLAVAAVPAPGDAAAGGSAEMQEERKEGWKRQLPCQDDEVGEESTRKSLLAQQPSPPRAAQRMPRKIKNSSSSAADRPIPRESTESSLMSGSSMAAPPPTSPGLAPKRAHDAISEKKEESGGRNTGWPSKVISLDYSDYCCFRDGRKQRGAYEPIEEDREQTIYDHDLAALELCSVLRQHNIEPCEKLITDLQRWQSHVSQRGSEYD